MSNGDPPILRSTASILAEAAPGKELQRRQMAAAIASQAAEGLFAFFLDGLNDLGGILYRNFAIFCLSICWKPKMGGCMVGFDEFCNKNTLRIHNATNIGIRK